ncbi:hypothetical protein PROFUN_11124 [Planoprotostelium fungivorum]|uniref:Uncharacterized protein n=1 Tax=Planoprotostelium fungivorum TaxID=1890364 RepID=A0A2P6NAR9_9EUKA|nr:hypothetical protein PROFUN_11124 [Planoprotostelium fungivorum]
MTYIEAPRSRGHFNLNAHIFRSVARWLVAYFYRVETKTGILRHSGPLGGSGQEWIDRLRRGPKRVYEKQQWNSFDTLHYGGPLLQI